MATRRINNDEEDSHDSNATDPYGDEDDVAVVTKQKKKPRSFPPHINAQLEAFCPTCPTAPSKAKPLIQQFLNEHTDFGLTEEQVLGKVLRWHRKQKDAAEKTPTDASASATSTATAPATTASRRGTRRPREANDNDDDVPTVPVESIETAAGAAPMDPPHPPPPAPPPPPPPAPPTASQHPPKKRQKMMTSAADDDNDDEDIETTSKRIQSEIYTLKANLAVDLKEWRELSAKATPLKARIKAAEAEIKTKEALMAGLPEAISKYQKAVEEMKAAKLALRGFITAASSSTAASASAGNGTSAPGLSLLTAAAASNSAAAPVPGAGGGAGAGAGPIPVPSSS